MNTFKTNLIFNQGKPLCAYTTTSDGNAYPLTLDCRDLVLKTEDQGQTSMCAAYTATSWFESLMWRRTGKPVDYNPEELYNHAKQIDGLGGGDGTTLEAVMKSIIDLKWDETFKYEDIKNIYNSNQLKRTIQRYGNCLLGFEVTDKWFDHNDKLVLNELDGDPQGRTCCHLCRL